MAKHKVILSLAKDKLEDVETALRSGKTGADVAKIIQNDWKLLPHVSYTNLVRYINRYKSEEIDEKLVEAIFGGKTENQLVKTAKGMDVLEEMLTLATIQRQRVAKVFTAEKNMSHMITDQTSRVIRDYSDLLEQIAKLQLETGILKRAPKIVAGQIENSDGSVSRYIEQEIDETHMQAFRERARHYIKD